MRVMVPGNRPDKAKDSQAGGFCWTREKSLVVLIESGEGGNSVV